MEQCAEPEEAGVIRRPFAAPPTLFRVPREEGADAGGLAHCPQCSRLVSRRAVCCPRCDSPLRAPEATSAPSRMLQPYRFRALSQRTPGVVSEARTFCLVNIIVTAIPTWFAALGAILTLISGQSAIGAVAFALAGITWILTSILVYRGLDLGARAAWYGCLVQGLLLASGTAAALYFSDGCAALTGVVPAAGIWSTAILSRWFRRDTRAWFSLPSSHPRMLPLPAEDRLWSPAQERGEGKALPVR